MNTRICLDLPGTNYNKLKMKADIEELIGEHLSLCIIKTDQVDENGSKVWDAILYNHSGCTLQNILVNTKGYGAIEGREVSTATMRYFKELLNEKDSFRVEPIVEEVLDITNEFWISYSLDGKVYEKKFIFSATDHELVSLDQFDAEGYEMK